MRWRRFGAADQRRGRGTSSTWIRGPATRPRSPRPNRRGPVSLAVAPRCQPRRLAGALSVQPAGQPAQPSQSIAHMLTLRMGAVPDGAKAVQGRAANRSSEIAVRAAAYDDALERRSPRLSATSRASSNSAALALVGRGGRFGPPTDPEHGARHRRSQRPQFPRRRGPPRQARPPGRRDPRRRCAGTTFGGGPGSGHCRRHRRAELAWLRHRHGRSTPRAMTSALAPRSPAQARRARPGRRH